MSDLDTFRTETRQWLEANCPPAMRTPPGEGEIVMSGSRMRFQSEDQRIWFERMRDKGWFAPDWPVEYGGGGLDGASTHVLETELSRLKCRPPQVNLGIWMIGPVLLEFGTPGQKQHFLPPTARGEMGWCQGFSEPNAGSDLASLKTAARIEGEEFVVTGSKIWTSGAQDADYMYALVRTATGGTKQQGISMVLIDMRAPGITVRPIDLISGKSHFCQVFFDDVRVPVTNLVGPLNEGWNVAKRLLQHERRAMSKFAELNMPGPNLVAVTQKFQGDAQGRIISPVLRDKVAALDMEAHVQRLTQQRIVEMAKARKDVFNVSATMKYQAAETEKKSMETMVAALGWQGLTWEDAGVAMDAREATKQWLASKALSIAGGSSEVQLNIIAKRVLGLPE
ncbi:MAG: acyl-CoA dehydrogenase family protein [Proteobacteria bacterium]|nr:acyl-CoA dehydrogenase family protein [Pseudomonadota bacterium]HQR02808.1 acyl-CoA dehydrogenase family protein [Rhodocyclaceae bacterium]